jgi:hypothetical protein
MHENVARAIADGIAVGREQGLAIAAKAIEALQGKQDA